MARVQFVYVRRKMSWDDRRKILALLGFLVSWFEEKLVKRRFSAPQKHLFMDYSSDEPTNKPKYLDLFLQVPRLSQEILLRN